MFSNRKFVLSVLQTTTVKKNIRLLSRATLVEVGKWQKPRTSALPYDTGQLFLHKVFGFRGVVLFPWSAKVYERSADQQNKMSTNKLNSSNSTARVDESSATSTSTQTYYQVLIDERDIENDRFKSHGHTLLSSNAGSQMVAIQGLEAVSHEDILPYHPTESELFRHLYLSKLLREDSKKEPCFVATEKLDEWQKKYLPWLELTDVNKETTQNVCVTFMPFYMGCTERSPRPLYWWRYVIRLQNFGDETVTLRERAWSVYSNVGGMPSQMQGKGVVGEEPVLSRTQPVFQYCSHVNHAYPSGQMWGKYTMEKENGGTFDCRIPPCMLESKREENIDPTVIIF